MTKMTRMDFVASVRARIGWKALTADEYQEYGYAFLSTPNIKSRDIDFTNVNYISQIRYDESPELKLQVGDVLLAKDGSTLGITNTVRSLPRPATVNGSIAVIRPHGVDSRFLSYWLQGSSIQSQIQQLKDGMGVPHLFQADIRKLPVPASDCELQRRIADFLDDRVARIDQIIAARRDQEVLVAGLWLEHLRELTESSDAKGWGRPRVAQAFRTGSGSTPPSDRLHYFDGGVPWVNTGDVKDGPLRVTGRTLSPSALADFSTLVLYPPGSLVIAMYGQGATKGRAALLEVEACVNQACCVLQGDPLLLGWAFHWFRAHKPQVVELANGAGQPNLSQDIIRNVRLAFPPHQELASLLKGIERREAAMTGTRDALRRQIGLLQEYKQSLITAAVTGELDVTTAGSGIPG